MVKTVAILGASGFVGSELLRSMADDGRFYPIAVSRSIPEGFNGHAVQQQNRYSDLAAQLAALGRPIDVIINCVGYGVNPRDRSTADMLEWNVNFPVRLVEVCEKLRSSLIHLGSCSEYASKPDGRHDENDRLEPGKLYGTSKASGSLMLQAAARAAGVSAFHCRLFNIYGAHEAAHRLLPSLLSKVADDGKIAFSDGIQIRDWLYVEDVAGALKAMAFYLAQHSAHIVESVNVCSGVGASVREFVETAAEISGIPEHRLGFGVFPHRPDDIPIQIGNNEKLQKICGWTPEFSLRAGLEKAIELYFRKNGIKLQ